MHTGKSYKLFEFLDWTRRDIYVLIVLGVVPAVAYQTGNMKWLGIPWTVVTLLGTGPGEQSAGILLTIPKSQRSLSIATSPG
jgi:hypothetical protein